MSEKTEQLTHEEMQQALALHVWKNEHLREEIMKNPKAAIEKELGVKFDGDVKVTVVNQVDPNEITFVLPYNIHKAVGQELSDDQLEEVAGGASLGSTLKGLVKNNARQIGGLAGDKIGDALISAGAPRTGFSKSVGAAVGGFIASKM